MSARVRLLTSPRSAGPRTAGGIGALPWPALLAALLVVALLAVGALAARAWAQSAGTNAGAGVGAGSGSGQALYAEGCQSCHGISGEGVSGTGPELGVAAKQGAGPPLRGVSAGTVHLYLSTGYMPLDDPHEAPTRSDPIYDEAEIRALVRYVSGLGRDGPGGRISLPSPDPARGDLAEGRFLFTESCAGCHQVAAEGGVVGEGVAPELRAATDRQVAEAVRAGPYLMPRFSKRQISDAELDSLVAYVDYAKDPRDEGGWGIGHIGPIPEGLAAWLVAAIVLVGVARVIGTRTGEGS